MGEIPRIPDDIEPAPAGLEVIGLKEALSMVEETFNSDGETLDILQQVIDQQRPGLDDPEARLAHDEAVKFAAEIAKSINLKSERSKDIAQQLRLRIQELQNQT